MKKSKLPSLITILILTLLTSIVWVSLSVYRALTEKPTQSVPQAVSNPITPTLDQDTIKKIESGIFLSGSEVPQSITTVPSSAPTPLAPIISPTPTPVTTPTASPSIVP